MVEKIVIVLESECSKFFGKVLTKKFEDAQNTRKKDILCIDKEIEHASNSLFCGFCEQIAVDIIIFYKTNVSTVSIERSSEKSILWQVFPD
jgi:hypothetical protein